MKGPFSSLVLFVAVFSLGAVAQDHGLSKKASSDLPLRAISDSDFAGGKGTAAEPYLITNAGELAKIAKYADKKLHFKLKKTIDLRGVKWAPIATFNGTLDGGGFEIKNLKIRDHDDENQGLFGEISEDGVVKNLRLTDVDIERTDKKDDRKPRLTGGIAGYNLGTIQKCVVTGKIIVDDAAGLIVGGNRGKIHQVKVKGSVTARNLGEIGGIAGFNTYKGKISQTFADVVVTGFQSVGAITGSSSGSIEDSYAGGEVHSTTGSGGLVGGMSGNETTKATLARSYFSGKIVVKGYPKDTKYSPDKSLIGGLVGWTYGNVSITDSYAESVVDVKDMRNETQLHFGDLLGSAAEEYSISNSRAKSNVKASGLIYVEKKDGKAVASTFPKSTSVEISKLGWDRGVWKFKSGSAPKLKWEEELD